MSAVDKLLRQANTIKSGKCLPVHVNTEKLQVKTTGNHRKSPENNGKPQVKGDVCSY